MQDDFFGIEEIKAQTKTLHWFFTDIVGSSNPNISTKSQIRKINLLQIQLKNTDIFKQGANRSVVLPTGDGMAIGFTDSPETPLRLAIQLHELLGKYNKSKSLNDKISIRIGIDTGPVYFIKDVMGNDTVWGPGIILARRLMDLCGPNQIFASQKIGDDVSKLSPEYKAILHPIGDYAIKHGEQLLIYNIYGKGFGNKFAPKKGKIIEKIKVVNFSEPDFRFDMVEMRLDILDLTTMIAHHTMIWEARGMRKEPLQHVFYEIGGDEPRKSIEDLNISVRDGNDNQLEIISWEVNRPFEKKFRVKLNKPLKMYQKARLILEYDWEEKDGVFAYKFPADCKKFKCVFTAPKEMPITKIRVLQNYGLGKKAIVEEPPRTSFSDDKTIITWETKDKQIIEKSSEYEFWWK